MAVYWLSDRKGITLPIVSALLLLIISALMINYLVSPFWYLMAILAFSYAWAFVIPYFQKVQALSDPQGKVVSFGAFINLSGRAIGPATATFFISSSSYSSVVWIGIIAFVLCYLLVIPELMQIKKSRLNSIHVQHGNPH